MLESIQIPLTYLHLSNKPIYTKDSCRHRSLHSSVEKAFNASCPVKTSSRSRLYHQSGSVPCSDMSGEESICTVDVNANEVRKSCMKEMHNECNNMKNQKRKVHFGSSRTLITCHMIDPLFRYTKVLWWSKTDIDQFKLEQSDFTNASSSRKVCAMKYLQAYEHARQQVFVPSKTQELKKPMMTSNIYDLIVTGRSNGLAGLELYSNDSRSRRAAIREIILLTLAAYYDFKQKAQPNTDVAKMLRFYSRSLTSADRYWAVAMGNADHDAAIMDIEMKIE